VFGLDSVAMTSLKFDFSDSDPLIVAAVLVLTDVDVLPALSLVLVVALVLRPRVAAKAPAGRLAMVRVVRTRASFLMCHSLVKRRSPHKS
jgi:hypothetical protein